MAEVDGKINEKKPSLEKQPSSINELSATVEVNATKLNEMISAGLSSKDILLKRTHCSKLMFQILYQ